jgi:P-type Ca2+ transporter type 2C
MKQSQTLASLQGLTDAEVCASRQKNGANTLTPPKRASLLSLYLDKFKDPIIKILLVAACFSFILAFIENDFAETIGIFLAILFATSVGFYFERDAAKKFNVLNALDEESLVKVMRNGAVCQIQRCDVVVGDIVMLETGDEVPADGQLIKANGLQIDESSLTGEPIVNKHVEDELQDSEATYPSRMVLRGTMVMNGRGVVRVIAVGDATEIGKVARKSTEMTTIKTPLNKQLTRLAKLISKIGTSVAVATFVIFSVHDIYQFSQGNPAWDTKDIFFIANVILNYFMMSVTLIVMAVPEGLPMTVTLSLALNMRRMLKSNNLVRKLHACETMGAVTVICTDKTGTLTQNRMQVAEMVCEQGEEDLFDVSLALNTTAHLDQHEDGKGIGNPTEVALLLWLKAKGVNYRELRDKVEIIDQLTFSTERKYMATIICVDGCRRLLMKGAPEIVMTYCKPMSQEKEEDVKARLLGFQSKAMRTLAFAEMPLDDNVCVCTNAISEGAMCWQGMAAISDPLRKDVPGAVAECRSAGIKVKIVTGDTSATAIEIARQIGIWDKDTTEEGIITGTDFAALSDEEAYDRVMTLKVMSRARPADKQRLVELLQEHDEVVAVTGDGTNDAPALNHAQVGLSLGSSTSVAKEASDMTLLDDSFNSIVKAVMWGRSLYKNIQRFIFFQLVVNVTALLLVLAGAFIGTELPLTVTQILWVNLIMDTFAAMALASLPPSHEVMKEKPRSSAEFIISPGMGRGIISIGFIFFVVLLAILLYYNKMGINVHELTIFFTTFVMLQFWNLFNAKTLGSSHSAFHHFALDNGLMLVLVMIFIGQWLIVEFGGRMFRTESLTLTEWVAITTGTSVVLWIGELWRGIKRLKWKKE